VPQSQFQLLTETTETRRYRDIRTSGGPGEYIIKSFTSKQSLQVENEVEAVSGAATPGGRAAQVGPAPPQGVVPSGTSFTPFWTRIFLYLLKVAKV
jgi:hypothetical protein